jgi:glycosyltransferase involved in cell wall biosynthesis
MKILVISALNASSLFANAINTIKMANGFACLGHEVTIICRKPKKKKVDNVDLVKIYGLTKEIHWIQLPSIIGQHWQFALMARSYIHKLNPDFVYARSYITPWMTSRDGIPTAGESHAHPDNRTKPFLLFVEATKYPSFKAWVTISQRLANHYHSIGAVKEKILILPDAVDLRLFERPHVLPPSPFNEKGPHIVYAGHLYDYKGIPTILKVAKLLSDFSFHFVGGHQEDIIRQKERSEKLGLTNVIFHGLKPHSEVPPYLWHADVLLLPPSAEHPSALWTSPVKLGEYLASKTPVVATDIPSLRDWLTDDEVEFVKADNSISIADGILRILNDSYRAQTLSNQGYIKAKTLSYEIRAQKILEFCSLSEE